MKESTTGFLMGLAVGIVISVLVISFMLGNSMLSCGV